MTIISSQEYRNEDTVAEKIATNDYVVSVSREFEVGGVTYRAVVDGHHSYEAAIRTGNCPEFEEVETEYDSMLDAGDVEAFLAEIYIDCYWYNIETGRQVW